MYILVKDSIPAGKAIVGVAHASLACYLKYADDATVKEWLAGPFYKTVCSVNEKEFEKAKSEKDRVVMTESTLENQETVIAFKLPAAAAPQEPISGKSGWTGKNCGHACSASPLKSRPPSA